MLNHRALALTALLAFADPAPATSLLNQGPIASAEAVSIEDVLVGATLGLGGHKPATALFGRDFDRAARFRSAMAKALTTRFTAAGISVSAAAEHSLQVALFGGTVEDAACPQKVFFLVQVFVCQPGESRGFPERTILGVSDDSNLEAAVVEAAVAAVDEFIAQRAAFRKSLQ